MSMQLVLTIVFGTFETLTFAGAAFGWASLYPILIEEGFFSDGCDQNNSLKSAYNDCETQVYLNSQTSFNTYFMHKKTLFN